MPHGGVVQLDVVITQKSYRNADGKRHDIFDQLRLALPTGKLGAILGPSGCGKTTLLRIIAGLDRDFTGKVSLPGGTRKPRIGMVFQEPRLLPWQTVVQNIQLVAPEMAADRLAWLIHMLGLDGLENHLPRQLSLGLARRVAIARALAFEPELLLLDEPLASLDDQLRLRLRDEITSFIEKSGTTTLLVTHDFDDAIYLADRIFLLSGQPAQISGILDIASPRRAMDAVKAAQLRQRAGLVMAG